MIASKQYLHAFVSEEMTYSEDAEVYLGGGFHGGSYEDIIEAHGLADMDDAGGRDEASFDDLELDLGGEVGELWVAAFFGAAATSCAGEGFS